MKEQYFDISFRCFYPNSTEPTKHFQKLKLSEIPRWLDSYKFTHPNCSAISVKIWFHADDATVE